MRAYTRNGDASGGKIGYRRSQVSYLDAVSHYLRKMFVAGREVECFIPRKRLLSARCFLLFARYLAVGRSSKAVVLKRGPEKLRIEDIGLGFNTHLEFVLYA